MGLHSWPGMMMVLWLLFPQATGNDGAACMARAGSSYRWPLENKGLVAPVQVEFSYMEYGAPIQALLTQSSISMQLPGDYLGGFVLEEFLASNITVSPEAYRLVRIEIRKPGKNVPGHLQQLPHGLEVALVHQEVGGDRWANVVVGVEVVSGADSDVDLLTPMLTGSSMPARIGDSGILFSNPGSIMDLNPVWYNATFLHFWGKLPTDCGALADTRFFMRTATMPTIQATYDTLLRALQLSPDAAPLVASDDAWLVQACPSGSTCARLTPLDPAKDLAQYQQMQSIAVQELRERRHILDDALGDLEIQKKGALERAYSARDDLRSAESQLQSLTDKVSSMKTQAALVGSSVWDSKAPGGSLVIRHNTSAVGTGIPNGTSLISSDSGLPASASETCDSAGRSPIDVDTEDVIDPTLVSRSLLEPLQFKLSGLSTNASLIVPPLLIENFGNRLRITAPHSAKGIAGGPLGAIVANGLMQGVSYIDVHIPGEHAIDGQVAAMELQLFHQPVESGKPLVAVALRFDAQDGDHGGDNAWLGPIADAQPLAELRHAAGRPLAELHRVLAEGSTTAYFRYDGTATSPPCRAAQWLVVRDAGKVSGRQLASLKGVLPGSPTDGEGRARFRARPVALGTQRLVSRVVPVGSNAAGGGTLGVGHGAALRGMRRMQM